MSEVMMWREVICTPQGHLAHNKPPPPPPQDHRRAIDEPKVGQQCRVTSLIRPPPPPWTTVGPQA